MTDKKKGLIFLSLFCGLLPLTLHRMGLVVLDDVQHWIGFCFGYVDVTLCTCLFLRNLSDAVTENKLEWLFLGWKLAMIGMIVGAGDVGHSMSI